MDQLCFRGKDRFRSNKRLLIAPTGAVVLTVTAAAGFGGGGAAGIVLGLWGAVLVPAVLSGWRRWTRVGAAGITTCWGFGPRGRTWAWDRIGWIEVRHAGLKRRPTFSVRITLTDGRVRRLPEPTSALLSTDPGGFADKVDGLIARWELYSNPRSRVPPPPRQSPARRVSGVVLLLLTLGCLAGAVVLAAQLSSARADQRSRLELPVCTQQQLIASAKGCSNHFLMTVNKVSFYTEPEVHARVELLDDNSAPWELLFRSDLGALHTLHPGGRVTAATAADGFTVTDLSFDGRIVHTVDSSAYDPATITTGLVTLAFGSVLGSYWILLRRRLRYDLVSWWGPCSLPALLVLTGTALQHTDQPGPLRPTAFVLAGITFVVGLLAAAVIEHRRHARLSRAAARVAG